MRLNSKKQVNLFKKDYFIRIIFGFGAGFVRNVDRRFRLRENQKQINSYSEGL